MEFCEWGGRLEIARLPAHALPDSEVCEWDGRWEIARLPPHTPSDYEFCEWGGRWEIVRLPPHMPPEHDNTGKGQAFLAAQALKNRFGFCELGGRWERSRLPPHILNCCGAQRGVCVSPCHIRDGLPPLVAHLPGPPKTSHINPRQLWTQPSYSRQTSTRAMPLR